MKQVHWREINGNPFVRLPSPEMLEPDGMSVQGMHKLKHHGRSVAPHASEAIYDRDFVKESLAQKFSNFQPQHIQQLGDLINEWLAERGYSLAVPPETDKNLTQEKKQARVNSSKNGTKARSSSRTSTKSSLSQKETDSESPI